MAIAGSHTLGHPNLRRGLWLFSLLIVVAAVVVTYTVLALRENVQVPPALSSPISVLEKPLATQAAPTASRAKPNPGGAIGALPLAAPSLPNGRQLATQVARNTPWNRNFIDHLIAAQQPHDAAWLDQNHYPTLAQVNLVMPGDEERLGPWPEADLTRLSAIAAYYYRRNDPRWRALAEKIVSRGSPFGARLMMEANLSIAKPRRTNDVNEEFLFLDFLLEYLGDTDNSHKYAMAVRNSQFDYSDVRAAQGRAQVDVFVIIASSRQSLGLPPLDLSPRPINFRAPPK